MKVPVKVDGQVVGVAEVSMNGEVISAELSDTTGLPKYIRDMFLHDLADSLSIGVNMKPVLPLPYSRESYTKRWL